MPQQRKVTLSISEDLIVFADSKAAEHGVNRSHLISGLLEDLRKKEQDDLAREGYLFYAEESKEFAASSAAAFAEALGDDGSSW